MPEPDWWGCARRLYETSTSTQAYLHGLPTGPDGPTTAGGRLRCMFRRHQKRSIPVRHAGRWN